MDWPLLQLKETDFMKLFITARNVYDPTMNITEKRMSDNSDVQNFWNNFEEEFIQWNNGSTTSTPFSAPTSSTATYINRTTTTTLTTSTSSTITSTTTTTTTMLLPSIIIPPSVEFWRPPPTTPITTTTTPITLGPICTPFQQIQSHGLEDTNYLEFCLMKNCSFCSKCQPICDIHIIEPCKKNWSPLVETCCGICNVKCEAECDLLLRILVPLAFSIGMICLSAKKVIKVNNHSILNCFYSNSEKLY